MCLTSPTERFGISNASPTALPSRLSLRAAPHKLPMAHVGLRIIQCLLCLTQRWLYFIDEWHIKSYHQRVLQGTCSTPEKKLQFSQSTYFIKKKKKKSNSETIYAPRL